MKQTSIQTLVFVYLIVPFVSILVISFLRPQEESLRERLAELKARGAIMNVSSYAKELRSRSNPTDEEQWKTLVQKITGQDGILKSILTNGWGTYDIVPLNNESWALEDSIQDFSDYNAALLTQLHELVQSKTQLVLAPENRDWEQWSQNMYESGVWVGAAVEVSAYNSIRKGDRQSTIKSIDTLLAVRRCFEDLPFATSIIARSQQSERAIRILRNALRHHLLDLDSLVKIESELHKYTQIDPQWRTMVQTERAWVLEWLSGQTKLTVINDAESRFGSMQFAPMLNSKEQLWLLDAMEEMELAAIDDLGTFDQLAKAWDAKVASAPAFLIESLSSVGFNLLFACSRVFVEDAMRHRLACVAIGIEMYQLKHGCFPNTLEDLDEFGIDLKELSPLGGKPFGYQVNANTVTVWCGTYENWSTPPAPPPVDGHSENRSWTLLGIGKETKLR